MTKQSYAEKLKHPNWQRKRLAILNRAGFKCEECGDGESTLHVHHCFYLPGREPWEYEDDELRALCQSCHDERADVEREIRHDFNKLLAGLSTSQINVLRGELALAIEHIADGGGISVVEQSESIWLLPQPLRDAAVVAARAWKENEAALLRG